MAFTRKHDSIVTDRMKAYIKRVEGHPNGARWCVVWQSISMPACAFWYAKTLKMARSLMDGLR